jgi:hypothetical protein
VVAPSLDGLTVPRAISLDANANKFCKIPSRQMAGSLQHDRRQPGKPAILAAARGPRNLAPNHAPDNRGLSQTPGSHPRSETKAQEGSALRARLGPERFLNVIYIVPSFCGNLLLDF